MALVITIEAAVKATINKVWDCWTLPEHIMKWNHASDDWHTTSATNILRVGGAFTARMEAKDGSFGFDFGGVYDVVKLNECIEYTMGDGRKAQINFVNSDEAVFVTESLEAECQNSPEPQKNGWQSILDNFKNYVEDLG